MTAGATGGEGAPRAEARIADMMRAKSTLSFEVFPPKSGASLDGVRETIERLCAFEPDFFSCTFGAGGTDRGRNVEVCDIASATGRATMPHLTCVGIRREDAAGIVAGFAAKGIANVLALRGDFPPGADGTGGDFEHADALVAFLRGRFPDLCIGVSAYPEKHLTAPSLEADIARLKAKQDKGADFAMAQLCYDPGAFARFVERARKAGVAIPIAAGVMPALSYDATIRMAISNGCSIPADLACLLGRYRDSPADLAKAGVEHAARLLPRLLEAGACGLHLYSLNKWRRIAAILEARGGGATC